MREVGIIGCGTAGAAAAIGLARAGCAVSVFERVAEPRPVGAGLLLQPTGQAVLRALGVLDAVAARGAPIDRLFLRTRGGRTLADLRYGAIDPSWAGIGIHRGVLFEALYAAARAEPNVKIHTGREIRSLDEVKADLIVLADGAQSLLRRGARDTPYPWGALWFVTEDRERVFERELYQVAHGARRLYGVLPTGLGPTGETPIISLFWSLAARDYDAWRAGGIAAWKREVLAMDTRIAPFLERIVDAEQVTFARYRDVHMRRWHDANVVCIGDSAHATSPQLGQGANLALVDAYVLADCVRAGELARYTQLRARHLRYYQRMARWLTPLFQSDSRVLGIARDLVFPVANAFPPLRRHMTRTMAGVALGFGPRRFALPSPR